MTHIGMSARYVMKLSRVPWHVKAKMAVKKGVVLPMAWLKLTGKYFKLALPRTMVPQKIIERKKILKSWTLDFTLATGM